MQHLYLMSFLAVYLEMASLTHTPDLANRLGSQEVLVRTYSGPIAGTRKMTEFGVVDEFLGIPYAKPPVGELRFQKPRRCVPWDETLMATHFSPSCMQDPGVYITAEWVPKYSNISEDCLYLNVWTPHSISVDASELKPVLVWIHGGGFNTGSSSVLYYDGGRLSALGDVIVVTMNYRLGVFGFLSLGIEDAPGNVGLYDQYLAIEWIKNNAVAFGGDPNQITLFGQSAGSVSVSYHLISPLTQGLFQKAILQSGTAYLPVAARDPQEHIKQAIAFSEAFGCENVTEPEKVVQCLRNLDPLTLAKTERYITQNNVMSFVPSYGNDFMPENPLIAFQKTDYQNITTLMGSVEDEGSVFLGYLFPDLFPLYSDDINIKLDDAVMRIKELFKALPDPLPTIIADHYVSQVDPSDSKSLARVIHQSYGEPLLFCPTVFLANIVAKNNGKSYYYLNTQRPYTSKLAEWLGVAHFDDVPYVFGTSFATNSKHQYSIEDKMFSLRLMATWIEFIKTGKPRHQMGKLWPSYSSDKPLYMELNGQYANIGEGPHKSTCDFWYKLFYQPAVNSTTE